jgi:hypothetical protein
MSEQLENLVRTGGLKVEPPDADEQLLKELIEVTDLLLAQIQ